VKASGDLAEDPFNIIGTVIDGRYRVECVAGEGGFGVVYRAFHLGFEARIALKVLKLPREWSNSRRETRVLGFQREGRMLFELSRLHPSIVRAFETGSIWAGAGRAPYLSLEWLDGVSLDRELCFRRRRGLPAFELGEVLTLLEGPAAGLARAHAQGIAHRDVKPGNLFIDMGGQVPQVKILDFGIAKLVGVSEEAMQDPASSVTNAASFTPMYAAPEQWRTLLGPTGPWTDVHALGLLCVELLSGYAPFSGIEAAELRSACLDARARPTPAARRVHLAAPVEAVLTRAVALEPRDRYQDVGAFWQALCAAASWSSPCASPRIAALTDTESADAARAPASSLSTSHNLKATSVTRSRAARAPTQVRRAAVSATVLGVSFGIAAVTSFALVTDRRAGSASSATSDAHSGTPGRVQNPDPPRSAAFTLLASARAIDESSPGSLTREAESSGGALNAPHDRHMTQSRTHRIVRPNSLPVPIATPARPAPLPSVVARPGAPQPEVDLDDPGLIRRH
jgi:serine/threonine protein kinase